jgi:hypothetical protein
MNMSSRWSDEAHWYIPIDRTTVIFDMSKTLLATQVPRVFMTPQHLVPSPPWLFPSPSS